MGGIVYHGPANLALTYFEDLGKFNDNFCVKLILESALYIQENNCFKIVAKLFLIERHYTFKSIMIMLFNLQQQQ